MSAVHILVSYFFFQNLALVYGLGLAPVLGSGQEYRFRWGDLGFAALFLGLALPLAWLANWVFVTLLGLGFLRTLLFALVILALVHALDLLAGRLGASRGESLRLFTGPVNASCLAMGLAVLVTGQRLGIVEALLATAAAVAGYGAALGLHGGIMRRMELEWLPRHFRGAPFALISLGLVALVFMSLSSLLLSGL